MLSWFAFVNACGVPCVVLVEESTGTELLRIVAEPGEDYELRWKDCPWEGGGNPEYERL